MWRLPSAVMAARRAAADLTASISAARGSRCGSWAASIRRRGKLILTGSAATEGEALAIRDGFRAQIENHTAVRTNVTLCVLLASGWRRTSG
jgi:hypothetical protein